MSALRLRVDSGGGGGSGSVAGREPPPPDGVLTATPDAEGCDRSDEDCASGEEGPSPGQLYGARCERSSPAATDRARLLAGRFTWKIDHFTEISKRELRSNVFEVGGFKW